MTSMTDLAVAVDSRDPATGLAAVAALRRLADELEALHVSNARAQGWSWEATASALGVRRQSVHKKHARRVAKDTAGRQT
ncbi:MAG: helix-turn-helix domain-containing protein [Actinomycetota bacterium]|nr:helix-turn-helix domain-containing protein [Actinomycetota bacterium]